MTGQGESHDDGAQAHSPAYVRKQASQPKPLAGGLAGTPRLTRDGALVLGGFVVVVILLLVMGMGVAQAMSANTGAPHSAHAASVVLHPGATATTSAAPSAFSDLPTATPVPTVTPLPTATATPQPTATPRPAPTATPRPPAPPTPCPGVNCNPWGYNFTPGNLIYSPPGNLCSYFACISSFWSHTNGYVVECQDGDFSHSGGVQGACSYHGGEWRPLYSH